MLSLPALLGAQLGGLRLSVCWQERVRCTFLHVCVTVGDGSCRQSHTPVRANLHGRVHTVHS